MLFYLYICIAAMTAVIILAELYREKNWRHQLAMVIILIPFVLRIFHIK